MSERNHRRRVLHCFGSSNVTACKLPVEALGRDFGHDAAFGKGDAEQQSAFIAKQRAIKVRSDFPSLGGRPTPGRLVGIAQAIKPYDLVLTYGRGALNAVLAHTVFSKALGLPPLVHHDRGDPAGLSRSRSKRDWFRRIAMAGTQRIVVPNSLIERRAREVWKVPSERIRLIPQSVDTKAFAKKPQPAALRLVKRQGERWVGTFAPDRAGEELTNLVGACANLPDNWHLVIFGDNIDRDTIGAKASALTISDRVHTPGETMDRAKVIGLLDIYADAGDEGLVPDAILEAMAAGLPIVSERPVEDIVCEANHPFVGHGDPSKPLERLAKDDEMRSGIARDNAERARNTFEESRITALYRDFYKSVLGEKD